MGSSTYYTATLMAAAALLLMAWLSSSQRCEYRGGPRNEEAYREMFAEFMAKFGKTHDMAEQERRYAAFKDAIWDADELTFSPYYVKLRQDPMEIPTRSHEETRDMFRQWMAIHGKTYDSATERSEGFLRFKINLERVH